MRSPKNETAAYPGVQANHLETIPAPIHSAATQPEHQQKATPGSHHASTELALSPAEVLSMTANARKSNQSAGAGRQQP